MMIRCNLGIHSWTTWSVARANLQHRSCCRCNLQEERFVLQGIGSGVLTSLRRAEEERTFALRALIKALFTYDRALHLYVLRTETDSISAEALEEMFKDIKYESDLPDLLDND